MNASARLLPRLAEAELAASLETMPIVVLMGARQTGKSTLVRSSAALHDYPYATLDRFDVRAQATEDAEAFVRRAPRLIIDEVQREPDLLLAVKQAVDERPRREAGRFVLTGSANLLLMRQVSETLAGRASYLKLWPLTRRERLDIGKAGIWSRLLEARARDWYELVSDQDARDGDWRAEAVLGGYPTPSHELGSADARRRWFRGYVETYLERDLQDLSQIDNLVDFRRLMRAVCLRVGGLLNQTELSRDTGISRPTVHRYLNLMETSFQLVRIEPYSVNRTRRLVKSPKIYWSDTGLALHLAGTEPSGPHLENLVLADLVAWRDGTDHQAQILYWRTASGHEVDFVIETPNRLLPVEVKATRRPRPGDARYLRLFIDDYGDRTDGALVLHAGDETFWLAESILAAPWWRVL